MAISKPLLPKDSKYDSILVAIPTFGMASMNFLISQWTMKRPILTSHGYTYVQGKPVDVARNEIAYYAMHGGKVAYVFFRDDDVLIEQDALIQLYGRISRKTKANPKKLGDSIVGGVVYSKEKPPIPMMFRSDTTGPVEDWNPGDLVKLDIIGMGCTLIPVGVFFKVEKEVEFWQCCNEACAVKWHMDHTKPGNCEYCGRTLVPVFFRTIERTQKEQGVLGEFTEDSYFCLMAKRAGIQTYCDTGVQCKHEDFSTNTRYYYHTGLGYPVWEIGKSIHFWPDEHDPAHEAVAYKPKKGKVRFNVGCGDDLKKKYTNIDLYNPKADFTCDVKDLQPAVAKYGQADEIVARHVLEHIPRDEVIGTVRNWVKALKPGGVLKIEVPDGRWALEQFLEKDLNGNPGLAYNWHEAIIHGLQSDPGQYHYTIMTERKLERIFKTLKSQVERVNLRTVFPKTHNQQVIRATVTKRGAKREGVKG
jgi:predicted SAM-dependent methyltransferase